MTHPGNSPTGTARRSAEPGAPPPAPGQAALVMAALLIGLLLMALQLWLLTVALELYLSGAGGQVWQLALTSGAIFLGGLAILQVLRRRPEVRRVVASERGLAALLRRHDRRS